MTRLQRRTDTIPVMVRMPQPMADAIDAEAKDQEDAPSRPEMVRRILEKHYGKEF